MSEKYVFIFALKFVFKELIEKKTEVSVSEIKERYKILTGGEMMSSLT